MKTVLAHAALTLFVKVAQMNRYPLVRYIYVTTTCFSEKKNTIMWSKIVKYLPHP